MNHKELSKQLFNNFIEISKLPFRKNTLDFSKGELAVMYQLYKEKCGLSAGTLKDLTGVGSGRMADALKSLESKNLILRKHDEKDKRRVIVYLSKEGISLVEKRHEDGIDQMEKLLNKLGEKDAITINALMTKIVEIYKDV